MTKKNTKLKLIILASLLISVIGVLSHNSVKATQVSKPAQSEVIKPVGQSEVIVRYVDELGTALTQSTILMGNPGDSYRTTAKNIKNFKLIDPAPTNANGVFTPGFQIVTYTYTRLPGAPTGTPIYAIYRGLTGILDEDLFYGNIGDKITISPKKIAGYVCHATPTEFIFSQKSQGVIYQYAKAVQTTVTMRFVDESGNKLTNDIVNNVEEDTIYTAKPATISNYTLTKMPDNAKGVVEKEPVTVTFIYSKNVKGDDNTSSNDRTSNDGSKTSSENKSDMNSPIKKHYKKTLPQTGENSFLSSGLSIIGLAMIIVFVSGTAKQQISQF